MVMSGLLIRAPRAQTQDTPSDGPQTLRELIDSSLSWYQVFADAEATEPADAQAVLRADPSDPNQLDRDRDGIACESNPPPRDLVPVPRQ